MKYCMWSSHQKCWSVSNFRPWLSSGKISGLGGERFQVRNPIPPKIRRACGHGARKVIRRGSNVFPLVRFGSYERGVPVQVSSSSSDSDSKLRDPSPNSLRVASKRDVNITKLKQYQILDEIRER
ncbi:hypothetical protein AVEN_42175-1 [Araneus ventricosus]|uniref:Uncharacterized protein n=1 Tax=Araneus ventricosus TaxID=182803 RepID=A0A4Y2B0D0_ARAVE|nr:hypothetical protein AVEN_42175-1 [Araneus ventricosus]